MNQVQRSTDRADDGHLIRQRLVRLLLGSPARLTILVAPGGFGKTTLLSDFVRQADVPYAWLTLNEWDRDAETFANRLVGSLNGLLDRPVSAPSPATQVEDREGWARAVTDRVIAGYPHDPTAVILDDYQEGEGDEGSRLLLETLILRLPPTARVLIASRSMPRLGALPRLLSRGEAMVVDTPILKFNHDELLALTTAAGDADPSAAADRLWSVTNGWPAAVTIAARSPSRDTDVGPGSPELLLRHLIDESLADLDRAEIDTVLRLSVFESMSESLCQRVPDLRFDEGLLAWLASTGLPVASSIEESVPTYRFHPLLREHLLRRLSRDLGAYRRAEQDAAKAYLGAGLSLPALQHFVRADDNDALVEHTPRVVTGLLRSGRWSAAVRLFSQMPPSWLEGYPEFRLLYARALYWSGDSDAALEQIAILLGFAVDATVRVQALAVRAGALRKKGEYEPARIACADAMKVAEGRDISQADLLDVRRELGLTLGMQGDLNEAATHLAACLSHFEVVQDRENAARIRDGLGIIHAQLGDLALAASHLRRALAYWEKLDNAAAASATQNNVGMVLYTRGEVDEARLQFQQAVDSARSGGNRYIEAVAESSLGDLDLDAGDFESAVRQFQRSLAVARELDNGPVASYAQASLGRAYLSQGQVRKAEVALAEAAAEIRNRSGRAELAPILVLLARARMAMDSPDEAEEILREAVQLAETHAPEEEARARLWLAECLLRHGTKRHAMEELQRIEALGEQYPIWRTLEREAPNVPRLAQYGASRLNTGSRLGRLFRTRPESTTGPRPAGATAPVEIHLFAAMSVSVLGTPIDGMAWRTRRARELFAYFLLEGARSRRETCLALWPDDPPETIAQTFKVTLHRLRRAIEPIRVELRGDRHQVVSPHPMWCDVLQFRDLTRQARAARGPDERIELLTPAEALYQGPLAKEFDSEWADRVRAELENDYVRCLAELAQFAVGKEHHTTVIAYCETILGIDPLNDAAALQLMLSHASLGQPAAVADTFHRFRRRLNAEGLDPSPALVRVYRQLQPTA